jgi:ABC-type multidrug transport system fused ATPase/permease subunit
VSILCLGVLAVSRGFDVPVLPLLLLLLAYAPAAITLAYCLSFAFDDAQSAQKWFPASVNALVLLAAPLLLLLYVALAVHAAAFAAVFVLAALLPFYALFAGFALLVLAQYAYFAGVVAGAVGGLALWALLLWRLDARQKRPLRCEAADSSAPRWLRARATEAADVRAERVRVTSDDGARAADDAIVLRNVKRRFGKGSSATMAVRGVSLGIARGEVFGLLGQNGAGKSTLLGILSGAVQPDEGTVRVEQYAVPAERERVYETLGVCQQHDCLYDVLTPREHFRLFSALKSEL